MGNLVYKYRKLDRAREILEQNKLHFSFPIDLQDPLDSLPRVQYQGMKIDYDVRKERKFAILSFSKVRDSKRLWEEYADNHMGICLGFRTKRMEKGEVFLLNDSRLQPFITRHGAVIPKGHLPIFDVEYDQHILPDYESGGDHRVIFEYLRRKTPDWKHESERRVFLFENQITDLSGEMDLSFDGEALEEIIFGAKVSEVDKNEILKIVSPKYRNSNLLKVLDSSKEPVRIG